MHSSTVFANHQSFKQNTHANSPVHTDLCRYCLPMSRKSTLIYTTKAARSALACTHEQPPELPLASMILGSRHSASQNCFFRTDTGKAFTIVLAGLALTMTVLPKTSLLPAFVAGFNRVLIIHKPGSTNFPAFFTSFAPISAKLAKALAHSPFLISVASESA